MIRYVNVFISKMLPPKAPPTEHLGEDDNGGFCCSDGKGDATAVEPDTWRYITTSDLRLLPPPLPFLLFPLPLTGFCLAVVRQELRDGSVHQEVNAVGRAVPQHERERAPVETPDPVLFEDAQQAVDRAAVLGFGRDNGSFLGLRLTLQTHFHNVTWGHH